MNLRELLAESLPRLQAISDEQASFKPEPEVWSAKQILGHLVDSSVNNYARLVQLSFATDLDLARYAQNEWVELGAYQERSWPELITLWQATQLQMAYLISHLPPESLSHTARIGGSESLSLGFLAEDYGAHQSHHLAQIWARVG